MPRLFLGDDGTSLSPWSTGAIEIVIHDDDGLRMYPMSVACHLGSQEELQTALLDTGSELTVIGGEIAEELEDELGPPISTRKIKYETRAGTLERHLHQLNIRIPSLPDYGTDLEIDAKVLVLPSWQRVVLGVHGFLELIRFGIEPYHDAIMYFGLNE